MYDTPQTIYLTVKPGQEIRIVVKTPADEPPPPTSDPYYLGECIPNPPLNEVSPVVVWRDRARISNAFYLNDCSRRGGDYVNGWEPERIISADTLMMAMRAALLDAKASEYLESRKSGGEFSISNTDTMFDREMRDKNIRNFPPHVNIHFCWPAWAGDTNIHAYVDPTGKVERFKINYHGCDHLNRPTLPAAATWVQLVDEKCVSQFEIRYTVTGAVEFRRTGGSTTYSCQLTSPLQAEIQRNGTHKLTVKRLYYRGLEAKIQYRTQDLDTQFTLVETILADGQTGKLLDIHYA